MVLGKVRIREGRGGCWGGKERVGGKVRIGEEGVVDGGRQKRMRGEGEDWGGGGWLGWQERVGER